MNQLRYSIQQLAKLSKISPHTLRYYERIGLILNVQRAPNGHRRYSDCDLERITFLKQLKTTGMSLGQMQKYADLRRKGEISIKDRRQMLESHREATLQKMEELANCLAVIDSEIDIYREKEKKT